MRLATQFFSSSIYKSVAGDRARPRRFPPRPNTSGRLAEVEARRVGGGCGRRACAASTQALEILRHHCGVGSDAAHRREEETHRQVDQGRLRMVAQVRDVLHGGDDAAAAYATDLALESLHQSRLLARDAGEQFREL